jgi:hypothetical protein
MVADRVASHAHLLLEHELADKDHKGWQAFLSRAQARAVGNQAQVREVLGSAHGIPMQCPTGCDAALWMIPVKVIL